MITSVALKSYSVKDLAELAKSHGLAGWHAMKKDQLIRAIVKARTAKKPVAKATKKKAPPARPTAAKKPPRPTAKPAARRAAAKVVSKAVAKKPSKTKVTSEKVTRKIHAAHEKKESRKDLSHRPLVVNGNSAKATDAKHQPAKNGKSMKEKDRIVLMVRDPYWLHCTWEVTRNTVMRAQSAMSEHWHTAKPILRLLEVDAGTTTSTAEKNVREIEVHGGVQNWYIEIQNPPKSHRVELGYKAANGKWFSIVRSNVVTSPAPGGSDFIDENWNAIARDYEKIYALSGGYNEERTSSGELQELFEERLRRPMGPTSARYGVGAERLINRHKNFHFHVDAEILVFGSTSPDAHVTLSGEPVKLRPDGTFTVRLAMPDRRQVIPAVSASADGVEKRTVVLAVERNTKVLEPMMNEQNND
jgi:uncharacterized protein